MKLSKETLSILKNYSSINQNLLFSPGNILKTITTQNTLLSTATVPDEFPIEFGIYDLSEFLSVLSLFQNPELEFSEKYVKIFESNNSIKYYAADSSVLVVPKKDINFPDAEIELLLTADNLSLINKTASVLKSADVSFVGQDGKVIVVVADKKNDTSNSFELVLGDTELEFKVNIILYSPND